MRRKSPWCAFLGVTGSVALLASNALGAPPNAGTVASSGVIRLIAMNGLETQAASNLDTAAIGVCHTMARQGITVIAVQIVTQSGQLIRQVGAATLQGC